MTSLSTRVRRIFDEPRDRFGLLLGLLVLSFVVSGLDADGGLVRLSVGILNLLAVVVTFVSTGIRPDTRRLTVILVLGALGAILVSPFRGTTETSIGAMAQVVVLGAMTYAVLRRIVSHHQVTEQTIMGAIAAYFLLGQLFAWIYLAMPGYVDGEVIQPSEAGQIPMYYSYVVLTTLGFGDVTPSGAFAERVTVLEALTGQIFLTVLVARLVSVLSISERRRRDT